MKNDNFLKRGKIRSANQISSSFSFFFIISTISLDFESVISSIFFFIRSISSFDTVLLFSIIRILSIYFFRIVRKIFFCCSHSTLTCLIIFCLVSFVVLIRIHLLILLRNLNTNSILISLRI